MLMSKQGLIVGLALFLLSSPWQLGATASAVELSSSVILFYNSELDKPMYGAPVTQCELLLRRAQKHGGRRVQIIPTHYWYDASEASQSPEVCYPVRINHRFCTHLSWPYQASSAIACVVCKPASAQHIDHLCLLLQARLHRRYCLQPLA
eukprot:GHUV01043551.1.p1 GENE.GHUV01043551.1~~GHUV01043551.1.p1  ORF type:complete len:150 (+),score=8.36 GHUV01043551.1:674-1123(+)